ncbi:hypothetical protein COV11_03065 [Candidatus Woesearchaeota archaeon CG10_big_fil_rev_8_21_14_0_10_30_7]|nr:MAG: hypothetical protein COV11_03065 [Candidatus Woesearchaeota archaeon CG10_big_fil_rev_8_21_14_0_10_30_7]
MNLPHFILHEPFTESGCDWTVDVGIGFTHPSYKLTSTGVLPSGKKFLIGDVGWGSKTVIAEIVEDIGYGYKGGESNVAILYNDVWEDKPESRFAVRIDPADITEKVAKEVMVQLEEQDRNWQSKLEKLLQHRPSTRDIMASMQEIQRTTRKPEGRVIRGYCGEWMLF